MGRDGKTRVGKGEKQNGGGKGIMGGMGQGMGWGRERERRKGREREERGYIPPNFNSWRRHCSWGLHSCMCWGVSPFVNYDKFSVIKDSFNDDNTEILLLLLNYHYDFCHIGYYLIGNVKIEKSALTRSLYFIISQVGKVSRKSLK